MEHAHEENSQFGRHNCTANDVEIQVESMEVKLSLAELREKHSTQTTFEWSTLCALATLAIVLSNTFHSVFQYNHIVTWEWLIIIAILIFYVTISGTLCQYIELTRYFIIVCLSKFIRAIAPINVGRILTPNVNDKLKVKQNEFICALAIISSIPYLIFTYCVIVVMNFAVVYTVFYIFGGCSESMY